MVNPFAISWLWCGFMGKSVTSKREDRLIPDEGQRKLYTRSLIAGSIVLAVLMAWIRS